MIKILETLSEKSETQCLRDILKVSKKLSFYGKGREKEVDADGKKVYI